MNVEEFEELIKLRNRIREKIYIRLVGYVNNNEYYEQLATIANKAAVAYIKNTTILTDKELDEIEANTAICY